MAENQFWMYLVELALVVAAERRGNQTYLYNYGNKLSVSTVVSLECFHMHYCYPVIRQKYMHSDHILVNQYQEIAVYLCMRDSFDLALKREAVLT